MLPAWWQTWWARGLGLLLLALLVTAVVQLRTGMLRRQQAVLERRVRERTAALEGLSLQLQEKSRALEASSLTDPLTGLHNRRFLAQNIDADVAQVVRRHEQHLRAGGLPPEEADLVFFLIDIDHFKQVNDEHGHAGGDAVLVQMRERLQQAFRQGDHLVRWGGEEFLLLLPDTPLEGACAVLERLRAQLAVGEVGQADMPVRITFSAGLVQVQSRETIESAIERADQAMYRAKNEGRDRIVVEPAPTMVDHKHPALA